MNDASAKQLFDALLHAESEEEVEGVLRGAGFWEPDEQHWMPFGGEENNFSTVGNQHAEPTGALVEKVINAIDARLMAGCFQAGIDPEGADAPATMQEAAEMFMGIKGGRLGDLTEQEQRELATEIQLIATGTKSQPNYLVVDTGEGQTPAMFHKTFLSLSKSNKLRIPFVQGKFNAGGTGVLQFCGHENFQLLVSRRDPQAPATDDESRDRWGFTLVRRVPPTGGRRSSMYVYLAPDGVVPSFDADEVLVLPGDSKQNKAGAPYERGITHGTAVKLYQYRWKAKSLATTEARFEIEKYLHSPCLPLRVIETRPAYRANYYSTTVTGIWAQIEQDEGADTREKVEEGFPAAASMSLPSAGKLDYKIVAFKEDAAKQRRRIPRGIVFTINGQVHGELPADFVSRRLGYEYLKTTLLVSVDCSDMEARAREDFFPGARDRVRRNETYYEIEKAIRKDLKAHPGLRALNQARRTKRMEEALSNEEDVVKTLNDLLNADPALRALFEVGDRLVSTIGPSDVEKFKGKKFPTYFRLRDQGKDEFVKACPINRACKLYFETDAMNDYFDREQCPGSITVDTDAEVEFQQLWNGVYTMRLRPPDDAVVGQQVPVSVTVTDDERGSHGPPFKTDLTITIDKPASDQTPPSGKKPRKKKPDDGKKAAPLLSLPKIGEVTKDKWDEHAFTEHTGLQVKSDGNGGYDYLVNIDNRSLVSTIAQGNPADAPMYRHWFKYGLAISAIGMLHHATNRNGSGNGNGNGNGHEHHTTEESVSGDTLDRINSSMSGLASVIIPIIRSLHEMPVAD